MEPITGAGLTSPAGLRSPIGLTSPAMGLTSPASVVNMPTTTSTTAAPPVSTITPIAKPANLADTVKNIQVRIAQLGPGPHSAKQQEELSKLQQLLLNAQQLSISTTASTKVEEPVSVMSSLPGSTSSNSAPSTGRTTMQPTYSGESSKVLDKKRLEELVKEVDPLEQLDDDVEEMLMQIADDFIDNVVTAACQLAKHRKANTVEVKDVQLHLERNWNMWIPGFGSEELRPFKKAATTEAHKQRMALIKKTLKKY